MSSDKLTVTWRMSDPPAVEDRAAWDSLPPAFTNDLPHPEQVELVITDRYQVVAGEYAVQSPTRANPDMAAADYQAIKADGTMAAASAAYIAVDPAQAGKWSSVPSMAQLVDIMSDLSGARQQVSLEFLAAHCMEAARMLRRTLQDKGFDSRLLPDGGLYFEVLW
jgi:hypothetical protein